MRTAISLILVFLLIPILTDAFACGGSTVCSCGDSITEDYVMPSNLYCGANGLSISAPNVTLNCNGHLIDGPSLNYGYGINVYRDGATIKNCNIQNFHIAIHIGLKNNIKILNNDLHHNEQTGIWGQATNNSNFSYNDIYNNMQGIFLYRESVNNSIEYNTFHDNSNRDIDLWEGENNQISHNFIYNGGWGGVNIELDDTFSNLISQNYIVDSYIAIAIGGGSANNIIDDNDLNNHYYGITLKEQSYENTIQNNEINHNENTNLWIYNSHNNLVYNNHMTGSTVLYGIYVSSSENNTIWQNNFSNNLQKNSFESANSINNNWDNGQIGNYWDDFQSNPGFPTEYEIFGDGPGIDHHPIYTPTCTDGAQNGDESGIDCGGSCAPCVTCNNHIKDPNEEGVDCGGACAESCNVLKILAAPVEWYDTQSAFETNVDEQIMNFINNTNLTDCSGVIDITYLSVEDDNMEDLCSGIFGVGTSLYRFKQHLKERATLNDYRYVLGFTNVLDPCGDGTAGLSDTKKFAWISISDEFTAAHEIGHFYGLEEQYCSNQAGSLNCNCNDGGIPFDPGSIWSIYCFADVNYLSTDYGCDPEVGDCCSECPAFGIEKCCEGNINDLGGRSIMSYAGAEDPRAFDFLSRQHLDSQDDLQCTTYVSNLRSRATGFQYIDVDLTIKPDTTIEENHIRLVDSNYEVDLADDGDLTRLAVFDDTSEFFTYWFTPSFGYNGPVLPGVDYSGISLDYNLALKIPYDPSYRSMAIYLDDTAIYETTLDFCNQDGFCDEHETYRSCWEDCNQYADDGLCIPEIDNGCDPDCALDVDPDCCIDFDGDGFGLEGRTSCLNTGLDCDDNNALANPGMVERCNNNFDDNCNGQINEGCSVGGSPIYMKIPSQTARKLNN